MLRRRPKTALLQTEFARMARRRWSSPAVADSTGQKLTYGRTLTAAIALERALKPRLDDQKSVGILLPASVGGALANLAVSMTGLVPINLNFTIGAEAMQAAIAQAGIRTILTARVFLNKANLPELPGMVFLEDVRTQIGTAARLSALLTARLMPMAWLRRSIAGRGHTSESLATIIFSSGSTGQPKGVMLSHRNILANVDGLAQIFPMSRSDNFVGVLPFFHSFGLTGLLWFPLTQGASVVYHPNPMDAKTIGELAGEHKSTMLISTPTFCQAYIRRCTREQFSHLRHAIVGAEKLREPVARAFKEAFGVTLLEGYGCTEMSPVIAVNRPNVDDGREHQIGTKPGTVGRAIPGVAAKIVDQDTGEEPIVGREGLLLVSGPSLMMGYLDQPDRTAEVIRDGWYSTGDIGMMDEDGFITITDRLSRFSKIGGEMVPHMKVEDAIHALIGDSLAAVTAVPDDAKGERLVAFYMKPDLAPEALWAKLNESELPRLWLPRRENLIPIDAIPTLGTGKVDLRQLKQLALAHAGAAV